MKRWTIYSKDGQPRYTTHVELDESGEVVWQDTFELHDEWMAECFLTLTIKNPVPVDFCVGDYIDYRGERYSINYDPSVIKKARSGSYSEGFTYDNIKFVSVQDEIVRCDFIDIVLSDNNVHYTSLPVFPFYCETVDDLLDRIQACLEELYPGKWIIISPDNVRNRQRGLCVNRASEFISAYNKYIGENTSFKYEKTGVALTANNITCWDAMKFVHDEFGLNFIVRGRCVIVGTVGVFTSKKFRYGKGNGLYEIERIGDPEQQIVTRLRGYGNETNLPDHYYATLNLQVFANVEEIRNVYSYEETPGIDFTLNLDFSSKYFNYRSKSYPGATASPNFIVKMEANDHAVIGYITKDSQSNRCYVYCEHTTDGLDDRDEPDRDEMAAFSQALKVGDRVYFRAYVEKGAFGEGYHSYSTQNLPDNMEINRLMLPGFPNKSLQQWVQEHSDDERIAAAIAEGFTFSDNKYRPYIDSPNKSIYDIRPANIYFDGSNDTDDIFPTLAGMTYQGTASDAIVSADQITDNGVLSIEAKDSEKRVNVVLPYAGFDLSELWSSDATIEIKDGMCGARSLKIVNKPTRDTNGNWLCACERAYDETLHLYYPYSDFQIKKGDKFVLTGIELPDEYVEAASERLFFASLDALRKNHAPRYTFQPRIDEIWMQRQHDQATSGGVASLHDTLKAGDIFLFADDDLGIDAQIIIDVLTIKENANNGIPTYEITLRDEKVVSAIDKIQNKIVSALGVGGGSGMSSALYSSLVSSEGSGLFLSKVYDDEAQGVIGFLSGAWFGIKTWFIDALGDANLNNVTVNGVLKALYSYINKVQSTNYTGDGIFDTGWRIINDYEGGNSKATFDYLYVRKKFTAEELEIRKITSIGGNFCLSPSSGRIWKIDYFDGDGTLLGYDIYSVPWTLGGRIMTLFKKNPLNRFLAHEKKLQRKLTDEERARVRKIRCYQFCDDGSTQTMSNWTVGAQARCQTFNVKQQMEFDGSSWKGVKVSNTYWWRLVSGVGSMMMEDGSTHDYVDFLVNTGNSATEAIVAEPGSDWPSVGDMMVQVGHRTDPEQMNVIMLETVGEDAPAFKEYRNINSWSLEGKRKTMISPKSGNELYATRFIIETEYGDNIVPVDRGLWVDIVPDADGNRRCYYYDRVAHNGALWLCMVAEGYHYEKDGRWLTQQEVDAMSLEEQKELDRVRNWTGVEPGDATAEQRTVWVKSVYAGIAPYLKFSDALIAIPCEKDGKASEKFTKTVTVKLMVTNLEATITKVEMEGGNSHVKLKNNTIKISYAEGDTITNKDYTITVEGDCQEQHYVATDKISIYAVIRGNDAYEVSATPSSWIWAQEGANLTSQQLIDAMNNGTLPSSYNIMIDGVEEVNGKMGNSAAQISVTNDGVDMPFQIVSVYASDSRVSTEYNNLTGRIWVKSLPNDLESGYIDVNIVYGNAAQKTLRIPFHCNLLGKWRELILGDTQLIIADKTRYIEEEIGSINEELDQARLDFNNATKELSDVIGANKEAQEEINEIIADGIIDAKEKATLKALQKSLKAEYNEAISAYQPVHDNEFLKDSTVKTALETAKTNVDTAYTNVDNKITQLLEIEVISSEKAAEVNSVFTAFDEKLQAFRTALENAANSITAQIAAESDSKIAQALAEAKSHADAAKAELNDIIEANKTAQETLNGVMADGIIDAEEKATLRSMQKSLLTEYDEAIAAYSPVYENEYLKDSTVKKALKTAKNNVVTAYTNVNNKINELLAINNISREKAAEVNSVFTAFDEKLQAFRTALENAANSITAQIASEADTKISQALAEAKSYANTAIKELDDVVKANKAAQDEVNAAVADGIITAEEKGTLKALQKSLQVTYDEAVAAYAPVYNNSDLADETVKTNLANAKSGMDSAYTAVNNALTTLIAKNKVTSEEAQSVNSKFATFDNKLKAYRTALENATNAIIERIKALGNTQYESFHAEYVRSSQENSANFEAIRTSLLNLERADTNLQKNIDDTKSDLQSSINSTKNTLQGSINSVSDELSEAKTNLSKDIGTVSTNLATYKQTADANIEALASRVTNNETSISNQNTRISTAEGNINTISSTLTVHGRDITSINTRVSTAETNISTISTKVDGKLSKTELYQEATRVGLAVYATVTTDIANAKSGAITTAGNNADTKISDYNKKVLKTGINVDNQVITIQSDNVRFCSSDGTVRDYVKITSDGKIKATDVDLTGKITATNGSIGNWKINNGSLECDGTPYISAYTNGYRFVAIGGFDGYTGNATIRARNDGAECIHVESYAHNGSTGTAISTLANQGGYSIRSWGNTWFTVRSGEEFKILGDSYGFRVSASGGVQVTSNGGTNWYNVTSSEGVNVSWSQITGKPTWIGSSKPSYSWSEISSKPSWIGSSKPSYDWSEISNRPTTMPNYYNLYWKYGTNNSNFSANEASGTYDGANSSRFIAIPTASISGRTITINGTSITVPESGGGAAFNGGEITNDLWLHTSGRNYGSTLFFGDKSYVYLKEETDDVLTIHATSLKFDAKITQEVFFNMNQSSSGGDKPILKFYNDNNWIGYYNCGSGWGTHGMMIKTNDFEVNGGYHISLYTASSSSYFVINKTNISASHSISTGSDIRLKDEVGKLEKRVEEFAEAPLVRFTFKADEDKVIHVGSYAQYWQNVLPESVTATENPVTKQEYLSMSYSEIAFVGMVTNSREIVTLKAAVKARDNKIKTLENEVADMKETIGTQAQQIERILGLLDGLLFNNQNS